VTEKLAYWPPEPIGVIPERACAKTSLRIELPKEVAIKRLDFEML